MRFACWIIKAADTNSEYVILIAFPLQNWLQKGALMFHCAYIACLFVISKRCSYTRVGTLIVATIYLQLIQNRYMFRRFTVLQCSHQHCVQPVASDAEVVGYL